jgi:hypothetical protein
LRPSKRPRWISAAPAALLLAAANPVWAAEDAASAAPAGSPIQPQSGLVDPASLLLFSVELDQLTLTDGLAGYGDENDPLLPVGELSRLFEMDLEVLPAERRIIGRIGESRRSLVIDLNTGTARDGPRNVPLAAADVAVTPTDIYLKASALQRLLPLTLEVSAQALAIKVVPTEQLPIQSRQARIARLRELGGDPGAGVAESLLVDRPYGLIGLPGFDVQLATGYQTESPKTPLRYDIRAAADLAYGNFQGYIGSDDTGQPASARMLFERRSLNGGLLGPLKARIVSVGDTFTPSLSLGPRGVGGRGIAISTVPLDETNIFNRVDLRGELPIGYDVELYINDVLRSGQNTPAEGRYEFLNVPLSPGVNVVRIVTYGPRGERTEQTRIVNVGGGQLRRGEATFEFGLVEQNRDVLRFDTLRDPLDEDEVPIAGPVNGFRGVAAVNYGLTSFLTLSGGAAVLPLADDKYRTIYNAGVRTSLFGFATQIDAAVDDRGAYGGFVGLAGQVAGASVVFRHAEFRGGFLDENGPGFEFTRPTRRRTELSTDASLQLAGRLIPVSARAARYEYGDGMVSYLASVRASSSIGSFLLSSGFEYERTDARNTSIENLSGYFAASTFRDYAWQLRATIDYDILPELEARTLAISADRDITPTWALRLGIGQPLDDPEGTNVTVASIHRLRMGDVALSGEYNNADRSFRLGAQLSFGLSHNPGRGYQMTRTGPGSGGSVFFQAFMDDNGNGVRDEGEAPVKNVLLEGGGQRVVTGDDGSAFVSGVGAGPTARLTVGLEQLENPSVRTPPTTLDLRPRPGNTLKVDYPMQPTGDVLVKLNLRRPDGQTVGLAAARLVLVDERGRKFEAGTEFDGTAIFSSVPVGRYRVELEPEQAKRLRMRLAAPLTAVVKNDGGFGTDVEGEVVFEARPQEQAAVAPDLAPDTNQANE